MGITAVGVDQMCGYEFFCIINFTLCPLVAGDNFYQPGYQIERGLKERVTFFFAGVGLGFHAKIIA